MFSRLCSSGVALLAVALLAPARIPAAAAPARKIVNVDEWLQAGYTVDNPCTAATEAITLQGPGPQGQGAFHITGTLTFYASGTTDVNLVLTPNLSGTYAGVNYASSRPMKAGFGRFPPGKPVRGTSSFLVENNGNSPSFWLKVRFVINPNGNPTGSYLDGMVVFSSINSNGAVTVYGFDGVQCPR